MAEPSMSVESWIRFFPGDYLADTLHLSTEQHGAYLLLLCAYWRTDCLPDDDAVLARIARLDPATWAQHRSSLATYFKVGEGRWRHSRADREKAVATDRRRRAVEKSRAANEARARQRAEGADTLEDTSKQSLKVTSGESLKVTPPAPAPAPAPAKEEEGGRAAHAPRAPAKEPLPADWRPSAELIAYGAQYALTAAQVREIGEDFSAYWHAQTGAKALKASWEQAAQGWLRDEAAKVKAGRRVFRTAGRTDAAVW